MPPSVNSSKVRVTVVKAHSKYVEIITVFGEKRYQRQIEKKDTEWRLRLIRPSLTWVTRLSECNISLTYISEIGQTESVAWMHTVCVIMQ